MLASLLGNGCGEKQIWENKNLFTVILVLQLIEWIFLHKDYLLIKSVEFTKCQLQTEAEPGHALAYLGGGGMQKTQPRSAWFAEFIILSELVG